MRSTSVAARTHTRARAHTQSPTLCVKIAYMMLLLGLAGMTHYAVTVGTGDAQCQAFQWASSIHWCTLYSTPFDSAFLLTDQVWHTSFVFHNRRQCGVCLASTITTVTTTTSTASTTSTTTSTTVCMEPSYQCARFAAEGKQTRAAPCAWLALDTVLVCGVWCCVVCNP